MVAEDKYSQYSDANRNLLKQDIAIRIAEAANDAKFLYKSLMGNSDLETTYKYLYDFIGSFFSLYDQTVDNLKPEFQKLAEKGREVDGEEEEVDSIEEYFSQPLVEGKNQEGELVVDVQQSAMLALQKYRLFKRYLRKSGLMKLQRYEVKQRTYGSKD